jgi:hypothetical protein
MKLRNSEKNSKMPAHLFRLSNFISIDSNIIYIYFLSEIICKKSDKTEESALSLFLLLIGHDVHRLDNTELRKRKFNGGYFG